MNATLTLALALLLAGLNPSAAEPKPDRALIAIAKDKKQVYFGWRLLGTDPAGIAFNVYRSTDGGAATKLNAEPLRAATDFLDKTVSLARTNVWWVKPVIDGAEDSSGALR